MNSSAEILEAAIRAATARLPAERASAGEQTSPFSAHESEGGLFASPDRVPRPVREAILDALYEDRRLLTRKRRQEGGLSDADVAALRELNEYIAQWERVDEERATIVALRRLEALADRVAAIAIEVDQQR